MATYSPAPNLNINSERQPLLHATRASAPNLNINVERGEPLLHPFRNSACHRYVWVTFFIIFLTVGLTIGVYLLSIEDMGQLTVEDNYSLITRKGWKAKEATLNIPKLQVPIKRVMLTHTNTSECSTEKQCSREVNKVQNDHLNRLQEPDIGYNFLIAGDGQTYEGRGWNYQAMISSSNDNHTLVVAFIGVFNNSLPTEKQMNQAKSFLKIAESRGKLTTCYAIDGEIKQSSNQTQGFLASMASHFQKYFRKRPNLC